MGRRIYLYISIVFSILFLTGINKLWSAPDKSIVYQGTLRKDGKVITGNVNMEFNIVDDSGNKVYWTSGSTVVYVNRGLFRYKIGIDNKAQFDNIPWGDITPYIRVKITDDVVGNITFPDEGFSWTPYAMYADNIVGGALLNSTQTFTGINTFQNNTIFNSSLIINANSNNTYALTIDNNSDNSDGYIMNVSTNGNVGIGTNVPNAKLEIKGGEKSGDYIIIYNSGNKIAAWLKNK